LGSFEGGGRSPRARFPKLHIEPFKQFRGPRTFTNFIKPLLPNKRTEQPCVCMRVCVYVSVYACVCMCVCIYLCVCARASFSLYFGEERGGQCCVCYCVLHMQPQLLGMLLVLLMPCALFRVGQNRICTPYMTVYLVISLPNVTYKYFVYDRLFGDFAAKCNIYVLCI